VDGERIKRLLWLPVRLAFSPLYFGAWFCLAVFAVGSHLILIVIESVHDSELLKMDLCFYRDMFVDMWRWLWKLDY
jgi:hypothetical protein